MEEVIRIVKREIEREERGLKCDEGFLDEQRNVYAQALLTWDARKTRIVELKAALARLEGGE